MAQYTLHSIPDKLDRVLRQLAKQQRKSLNQVTIETLQRALNVAEEPPARPLDLTGIAGSWVEDPEIDAALEDQRRIEP